MIVYQNNEITVEGFEVGPFLVNTYIVGCRTTNRAAIVDPGAEGEYLVQRCRDLGFTVQFIVNTHGHIDHILENGYLKQQTGAPIIIHPLDAAMLTDPQRNFSAFFTEPFASPPADIFFQEGQSFSIGDLDFEVLHTPGHSPGSVCLVNSEIALVGDLLFYDSVGRSDFPGGSHELLIRNIREKLLPRGDRLRVFPGHGPQTTLGRERRENPFLTEAGLFI